MAGKVPLRYLVDEAPYQLRLHRYVRVVQQALQLIERLSIIGLSHALRLPRLGVLALAQKLRHEVPAREKTAAATSNTIVSSRRLSVIDGFLSASVDQINHNGSMPKDLETTQSHAPPPGTPTGPSATLPSGSRNPVSTSSGTP